MRAYTTEHATHLAQHSGGSGQTRTLGLGQASLDPAFYTLDATEQMVYNQMGSRVPTPEEIQAGAIVPSGVNSSTLLIGVAILALVMLSGGHN